MTRQAATEFGGRPGTVEGKRPLICCLPRRVLPQNAGRSGCTRICSVRLATSFQTAVLSGTCSWLLLDKEEQHRSCCFKQLSNGSSSLNPLTRAASAHRHRSRVQSSFFYSREKTFTSRSILRCASIRFQLLMSKPRRNIRDCIHLLNGGGSTAMQVPPHVKCLSDTRVEHPRSTRALSTSMDTGQRRSHCNGEQPREDGPAACE